MRRLLCLMLAAGLLLMPFGYNVQAASDTKTPPAVAQTLVREGDFAGSLAQALGLGTASDEAQAENLVTTAGIEPKNGWVADYPVTPDILGELQGSVVSAANSGQLKMSADEALKAFQSVSADYGLPTVLGDQTQYSETTTTRESAEYPDETVIDNYYYEEGPPVVSYYPPPWDYYYLYSWVPYPFWFGGFAFSGFFVMNDFHVFADFDDFHHFHHFDHNRDHRRFSHHGGFDNHGGFFHRRALVSNHVANRNTGRVSVIDPARRASGRNAMFATSRTGGHGFTSQAARTGATSIMGRSQQRSLAANHSFTVGGNNRSALTPSGLPSTGVSNNRMGALGRNGSAASAMHGDGRVGNLDRVGRTGATSIGTQGHGMHSG